MLTTLSHLMYPPAKRNWPRYWENLDVQIGTLISVCVYSSMYFLRRDLYYFENAERCLQRKKKNHLQQNPNTTTNVPMRSPLQY